MTSYRIARANGTSPQARCSVRALIGWGALSNNSSGAITDRRVGGSDRWSQSSLTLTRCSFSRSRTRETDDSSPCEARRGRAIRQSIVPRDANPSRRTCKTRRNRHTFLFLVHAAWTLPAPNPRPCPTYGAASLSSAVRRTPHYVGMFERHRSAAAALSLRKGERNGIPSLLRRAPSDPPQPSFLPPLLQGRQATRRILRSELRPSPFARHPPLPCPILSVESSRRHAPAALVVYYRTLPSCYHGSARSPPCSRSERSSLLTYLLASASPQSLLRRPVELTPPRLDPLHPANKDEGLTPGLDLGPDVVLNATHGETRVLRKYRGGELGPRRRRRAVRGAAKVGQFFVRWTLDWIGVNWL